LEIDSGDVQTGTTVVMSIHQPRVDIYNSLTQVIFLTRNGRIAYCGPPEETNAYLTACLSIPVSPELSRKNPADVFMDAMLLRTPEEFASSFIKSDSGARYLTVLAALELLTLGRDNADDSPQHSSGLAGAWIRPFGLGQRQRHHKYRPSWWTQFSVLSARCLRGLLRNWFQLFLHGVMAVAAALTLGKVFEVIYMYTHTHMC
jgi:hypothetical protein